MGKGSGQKMRKESSANMKKATQDNPFERRSIIHKKHEVFNRRVPGEQRNVAKARSRALERREKTLLADYNQSQKANSFQDRRFGEDDSSLLLEEKMWARMQKERKKRSRGGGGFNLEGGEMLTHKGQVLEDHLVDDRDHSEDDDNLDAEVVSKLHFGGGTADAPRAEHHKSRKEILDDIVAKSKAYKLERARKKEQQEDERERLDKGLGELLGILDQHPRKEKGIRAKGEVDDYDKLAKELVYEAKAQATDRLKTPEEAAREEKTKLEELEKARVRRMLGEEPDNEDKHAGAQCLPNDDELGEVTNGETNNPGGFLGSTRSDDESIQMSSADDESGDDESGDDESGDESDEFHEEELPRHHHPEHGVFAEDSDHSNDETWAEADAMEAEAERQARMKRAAAEEIPYVLDCPGNYEEFLAMLAKYAKTGDDINTIISRIHMNNSIKLDSRNKEPIHNFYGILLKRFRRVGDQTVRLPAGGPMDRARQLDYLAGVIYDVSSEMPEVAASLWHRTVGGMHKHMSQTIAEHGMGSAGSCWPSRGSLLLLKLLVHIFPSTDFRHPVVTPAVLFLSQCLSQCPVKGSDDLGSGLFCCALLLHCTLGAARLAPEGLVFLTAALANFVPRSAPGSDSHADPVLQELPSSVQQVVVTPSLRNAPLGWLRGAAASYVGDDSPPFDLRFYLGDSDESAAPNDRSKFAASAMVTIYKLLQQAVERLNGSPALPEILQPIMEMMIMVQPQGKPSLCPQIQAIHKKVQGALAASIEKSLSQRQALQWQSVETKSLDALVPKFQENYKMKKDSDKDVEKAKLKQLQRQVKRERKGAMRELKRDAAFLEHAKSQKKAEKDTERKRKLRENLTWLEEQQATMNQQVKLGGRLVKGGGSSSKKRPRVGKGY